MDTKRKKLYDLYGRIPIKQVRANVSKTLVNLIVSWENKTASFLVCKLLDAREKDKAITYKKVKQFISLYTSLLALMVQHAEE